LSATDKDAQAVAKDQHEKREQDETKQHAYFIENEQDGFQFIMKKEKHEIQIAFYINPDLKSFKFPTKKELEKLVHEIKKQQNGTCWTAQKESERITQDQPQIDHVKGKRSPKK